MPKQRIPLLAVLRQCLQRMRSTAARESGAAGAGDAAGGCSVLAPRTQLVLMQVDHGRQKHHFVEQHWFRHLGVGQQDGVGL